jgi:Nucleotidyl transferase AbiEii toxin, Type IV TA system
LASTKQACFGSYINLEIVLSLIFLIASSIAKSGTRNHSRAIAADVQTHIATVLLERLRAAIAAELGAPEQANWSLHVDRADPQTLILQYPTCLGSGDYGQIGYITPQVKLECGARGDPWPMEKRVIQSYAAEEYPDFFELPTVEVDVLSLGRTFWEKATLLHAEYHRPTGSPAPKYRSQHYSDVATVADHKDAPAAIKDTALLRSVVEHKSIFFRSGWASYETACPGTLHLCPSPARLSELKTDYKDMEPMMFDSPPPTFDQIVARLEKLERAINESR